MKTRVLLADDHVITRIGLRSLLESDGMEIVGEAANGREALRLARQLGPEVLVMDITMPDLNGIEAASAIKASCPGTQIVMLSMHADREHVHRALLAGALGYLLKGSSGDELIAAVRNARLGRQYLSHEIEALGREPLQGGKGDGPLASLSSRERQVLQLVVEGRTSKEVGALLNLSPKSVDTYRSRLMQKLGVAEVTALVKFAVQHGLTPSS